MNPSITMAGLIAERLGYLNMSQRQFADLVGMTTKHVNTVLNGRATADPKTLVKWAKALGCEFDITLSPNP